MRTTARPAALPREALELSAATRTSQANASKHLALLLEQGLVARRRDGLFTRYRIADPSLPALCQTVCGSLAERHETMHDFLRPRALAAARPAR